MEQFRTYRKVAQTEARLLTEADVISRSGVIQTPEGPKDFQVGDYLGRDAKGEWPIRGEKVSQGYQRVSEPDADGFARYQAQDIREARQMLHAFTAGSLTGKPGDYLVRSQGSEWPVDREIFESTYILVDPDLNHQSSMSEPSQ